MAREVRVEGRAGVIDAEAAAGSAVPYLPGWVDRLIDAIARSPGPAGLPYAIAAVGILTVSHALAWTEGLVPFGELDVYQAALALYAVLPVLAVDYLDRAALASFRRFAPALGHGEATERALVFQLTRMPRTQTLLASGLGIVAFVLYVASDPTLGRYTDSPLTLGFAILVSLFAFPAGAVLVYHTMRQLRTITTIHEMASAINLFQLTPLHAFSGLTALTAGIVIVLGYVSIVTDPTTLTNPALFLGTSLLFVLAAACFVLPLRGMHSRIVTEKERLRSDIDARIEAAIQELQRKAATRDLSDADPANKQLDSLIKSRTLIGAIPTWPWDPGTPRALLTAVALPIGLWLVFRGLERFLG